MTVKMCVLSLGIAGRQHLGRGHGVLQPGAQQRAAERGRRAVPAGRAGRRLAAAAAARSRRQRRGRHGRHHEPA